jgi:TDG/mug DNA glycosylase family protein
MPPPPSDAFGVGPAASTGEAGEDILPDLLAPGLRLVFCGTAASPTSARRGAYYAGPGNRFWPTLHAAGFTPHRLAPEAFRELLPLGIGLTDLAKRVSGVDKALRPGDLDAERLKAAIRMWHPGAIAFTSAAAARHGLGRDAPFGETASPFPGTRLLVLPSPSAANGHWARQAHHWHAAARALGFA